MRERLLTILFIVCAIVVVAGNVVYVPQDDISRRRRDQRNQQQSAQEQVNRQMNNRTLPTSDTLVVSEQPILEDEDIIPDSLLHPRWSIQRTTPITFDDLIQQPADLERPENMKQTVEYNDSIDRYVIGQKIAGTYVNAPIMMTMDEYMKWSERQLINDYFRSKNEEIVKNQGKEKFDFTDMHFDL